VVDALGGRVSEGSPVVPGSFAAGSRVAGYLLEEQIGQGGMAVVFRAHDERLDRTVALKILAPALAADEAFRQRFIRESRAAAAVDDPHIIPVFEAGEASGVLFIAMRFVRGGDVRSLVGQYGPLPPGRAVEIVSQVASALDAAHGRGLVHRDVKPANMLLDASAGTGRPDHVYLSDFGLSKGSLQTSGLTGTGTFLGTLDYISPEQIEGKPVDGRADEYALACAAYELLSGLPPFQREEAMAVMYAQLSEPPPTLSSRRPDLPIAADAVFARALAKSPGDRYANCREFTDALREALGFRPYDSGPGMVPTGIHPRTQLAWQQSGASGPAGVEAPAGAAAGSGPGGSAAGTVAAGAGAGAHSGDRAGAAAATAGPGSGPPVAGGNFGSQPTQLAGGRHGTTSPDLTAAHWQDNRGSVQGYGGYGGPPARPWWRAPATLIIAVVLVVVLGGGGAYLALKGKGPAAVVHHNVALQPPGPSSQIAQARTLAGAKGTLTSVSGGGPFGVAVSPDNKFVFTDTGTSILVYGVAGGALTFKWMYTITSSNLPATDMVLTHSGKYLLVAVGNGIDVESVATLESGAQTGATVATLTVPNITGYGRAIQIAITPDDKFAFVSLQFRKQVAAFSLGDAATTGAFSSATYLGSVNIGQAPVGLAVSGSWLYATTFGDSCKAGKADQGQLAVLSLQAMETKPSPSALKSQVSAGCSPARILVDRGIVWVTTRQSNFLLGFSAARLASSKPSQALIRKVQVGQNPIGIALVAGGTRIVIANNAMTSTGASAQSSLSLINAKNAQAGTNSLIGYIPSGGNPREIAVSPDGQFLYVSNGGTAQIQSVSVGKLGELR
jgi:DNA-binding beta-propeller fold protein YncE